MTAQVTLTILRETEKAFQVYISEHRTEWLPKSQVVVTAQSNNPVDPWADFQMPVWLAKRTGLWGWNNQGQVISKLI